MALNRDPINKALKAQSTHQELGARLSVYNRLGISKPGFWVGYGDRSIEDPNDEFTPVEKTVSPYEGLQPFEPKEYWEPTPNSKAPPPVSIPSAPPPPGRGGHRMPDLAALLRRQSNFWYANNRTATAGGRSVSVLDISAAQRALQSGEIATMLYSKGQQNISIGALTLISHYYMDKASERATARANRPFGQGLPTQFEQMQEILGARMKAKPKVKGNTGGVSVQQISQQKTKLSINTATPRMSAGVKKPQLNVTQNGYASSYLGFHW